MPEVVRAQLIFAGNGRYANCPKCQRSIKFDRQWNVETQCKCAMTLDLHIDGPSYVVVHDVQKEGGPLRPPVKRSGA